MSELPASKSQTRLLHLLSLTSDGTYNMSGRLLEAAGMPKDGLPSRHSWRTAGKLSDADLLAALPSAQAVTASVATGREATLERADEHRARTESYREFMNIPREPKHSDEGYKYFERHHHTVENDAIDTRGE